MFGYSSEKFLNKEQFRTFLLFSAGLNYKLSPKMTDLLFNLLKEKKMIKIRKEKIYLNHSVIDNYFNNLLDSIVSTYNASHIFDWNNLSSFVKDNFYKKRLIDKIYDYLFNAKTRDEEWENWHQRIQEQIDKFKKNKELPRELSDPDEKRYYKILHNSLVQHLPKGGEMKFAEIGSGSGALSISLQKEFLNSTAYLIDNAETALKYSSYVNKKAKGILADASKTPFSNNYFDFLYSVGLIEHFDDNFIGEVLKESYRILKPGGILFLAVPNFFSPDLISIWNKYGKGSEKYISKKKLEQYILDVGFVTKKVAHLEYVHPFFTKHKKFENLEKFLGLNGFGFLNYVICVKNDN